jgi:hypothetical protein
MPMTLGNCVSIVSVSDSSIKGHALEAEIETFFSLSGYQARRNVLLEGRSGGRHEIDVLAEKDDGITAFSLAVECKAWQQPIEKETVSKLAYVLADAGLNKGIIVSLGGWRLGAEQSAAQLGIELWGPEELERRLGQVTLARLNGASAPAKRALGLRPTISSEQALQLVRGENRGLLGFGKDELVWFKPVWLPFHLLELRVARVERQFLRGETLRTRQLWNFYEAIGGNLFASVTDARPPLDEVEGELFLQSQVKETKIVTEIKRTFGKFNEVVSAGARRRYAERLIALGIAPDCSALSVDRSEQICLPFFLSLLRKHGRERVVAIDAWAGATRGAISLTLTANLGYLSEALPRAATHADA